MNELINLVEEAQRGDRQAFGELVKRFQFTVQAIARSRLHDDHEAEELAQDVFLHAMKKLGQLQSPERFAGWLRQITVRMAINRSVRRRLFKALLPDIVENVEAVGTTAVEELFQGDMQQNLYQAIGRLKPVDRETLVQHHLQNRSLKQISKESQAPLGTIKRRLHVARKRLKAILEQSMVGDPLVEVAPRPKRNRQASMAIA